VWNHLSHLRLHSELILIVFALPLLLSNTILIGLCPIQTTPLSNVKQNFIGQRAYMYTSDQCTHPFFWLSSLLALSSGLAVNDFICRFAYCQLSCILTLASRIYTYLTRYSLQPWRGTTFTFTSSEWVASANWSKLASSAPRATPSRHLLAQQCRGQRPSFHCSNHHRFTAEQSMLAWHPRIVALLTIIVCTDPGIPVPCWLASSSKS